MILNMIMERLYEKELPKLTSTCFTKDLKNVFSKSNAKCQKILRISSTSEKKRKICGMFALPSIAEICTTKVSQD